MLSTLQRTPLLRRSLASTCRANSTLVIAEPTADSSLAPQTLSAITAASKLHGDPISLLTFSLASAVPEAVSAVLNASDYGKSSLLAETVSNAVKAATEKHSYTHVVCAGTKFGNNYLGRVGAMLGISPVSDVVEVLSDNTFVRPLYAGNALAKVISNDALKLISIRPTSFKKAQPTNESPVTELLDSPPNELTEWLLETVSKSKRPDLGSASVVISGGRGMKSGENFVLLEKLADKLGGAVGQLFVAATHRLTPPPCRMGPMGVDKVCRQRGV